MKKSVQIISLCLVGYCYATLGLADDQKDIKGTNETLPLKKNPSVKAIKLETLPQNIKISSQAKDGISKILGKPIPPSLMQRLKWESVVERDIGDTLNIPVNPDIKKFEVPGCTRILFQADLMGNDGVPEDYNMVSLMDCDGVNYVTPIKSQRGGSCGTYASTAALEILIAKQAALKTSWTTADHPADDFSPINLSEGYSLYSSHYYIPTAPVLDGIAQGRKDSTWLFASTVDHYYPDPLFKWNWGEMGSS